MEAIDEAIGGPVTAAQAGCLLAYLGFVGLWLYAELLAYRSPAHAHADKPSQVELVVAEGADGAATPSPLAAPAAGAFAPPSGGLFGAAFFRALRLDPAALSACREPLRAAVELGTIVLWFYVADRTPALGAGPKRYIRDVFLSIFAVLSLVAGAYTTRSGRAPVAANRAQTEEWKGWMQVLFLLYHYYEAREAYNAIRVFIASYVWMTGYGNFAYYHKSRDFSAGRFAQMMWRLNLLAVICCAALGNELMLYYICPMHTLYTVLVYATLALWPAGNDSAAGVWLKLAAATALVVGVWEFKFVFYAIFSPLAPVLGYTDPRRPNPDALHEWYFRTGLDRYIWVHGMACAYLHPRFEAWLKALDEGEAAARRRKRTIVGGVAVAVFVAWYFLVFRLPKLEYNKAHPYTSWIPISAFLVLRNLTPALRLNSVGLYGWLGCITLETYVAQYHTWLLSKVPNSQPIYLLTLLPGYPLLNFGAATALYIFVSHRLFVLTAALRDAMIPHDDNARLARNLATLGAGAAAAVAAGFVAVQARALAGVA